MLCSTSYLFPRTNWSWCWPACGRRVCTTAKVAAGWSLRNECGLALVNSEARFRSYEQIGGRSGYNYGHSLWQCNLRNELMRSSHAFDEEEDRLIGNFANWYVWVFCLRLGVKQAFYCNDVHLQSFLSRSIPIWRTLKYKDACLSSSSFHWSLSFIISPEVPHQHSQQCSSSSQIQVPGGKWELAKPPKFLLSYCNFLLSFFDFSVCI